MISASGISVKFSTFWDFKNHYREQVACALNSLWCWLCSKFWDFPCRLISSIFCNMAEGKPKIILNSSKYTIKCINQHTYWLNPVRTAHNYTVNMPAFLYIQAMYNVRMYGLTSLPQPCTCAIQKWDCMALLTLKWKFNTDKMCARIGF